MNIVRGNFLRGLSDPAGVVVAPTNGVITPVGLVMGAGAALALAEEYPRLRQALARRIEREGVRTGRYWRYGFVAVKLEGQLFGAFQSKLDFRQGADLGLIRYSAEQGPRASPAGAEQLEKNREKSLTTRGAYARDQHPTWRRGGPRLCSQPDGPLQGVAGEREDHLPGHARRVGLASPLGPHPRGQLLPAVPPVRVHPRAVESAGVGPAGIGVQRLRGSPVFR